MIFDHDDEWRRHHDGGSIFDRMLLGLGVMEGLCMKISGVRITRLDAIRTNDLRFKFADRIAHRPRLDLDRQISATT
ncbi:hypothetical protein ACRQ1B_27880 [Rhizobium panacihumi]|uniref:hypothetical protein n=1 Tax=Rhizobium panacihumi TaxID=2008450 RepID=UPI003D7BFEE3